MPDVPDIPAFMQGPAAYAQPEQEPAFPRMSREQEGMLRSGRKQSPDLDINLTPAPDLMQSPGPIGVEEKPSWIPQPMGPTTEPYRFERKWRT